MRRHTEKASVRRKKNQRRNAALKARRLPDKKIPSLAPESVAQLERVAAVVFERLGVEK